VGQRMARSYRFKGVRLGMKTTVPAGYQPGQLIGSYLHSSCADDLFGRVVNVEAFDDGRWVADLLVYRSDDLLPPNGPLPDGDLSCCYFVGPSPIVAVRNVRIESVERFWPESRDARGSFSGDVVTLDAPWGGCFRCVHSFMVLRNPNAEYYKIEQSKLDMDRIR